MVISVIIPAYNERMSIAEVIRRVQSTDFGPLNTKEVIVVDDGSTDGTRDILHALAHSEVKVILHEHNSGKGGALRTGIKAASGDVIVFQDADFELDPAEYAQTIPQFNDPRVNVVYGSRFLNGKSKSVSWRSYIVNTCLNILFNILYATNLSDLETGHKAFRADTIKTLVLKSSRFDIEVEVTAKLVRAGEVVVEIPVRYEPRTASQGKKMSYMTEGWRAGCAIFKYRFFS